MSPVHLTLVTDPHIQPEEIFASRHVGIIKATEQSESYCATCDYLEDHKDFFKSQTIPFT